MMQARTGLMGMFDRVPEGGDRQYYDAYSTIAERYPVP